MKDKIEIANQKPRKKKEALVSYNGSVKLYEDRLDYVTVGPLKATRLG